MRDHERGPAPVPPDYREADTPAECCGTCRMNDNGRCWGYGLVAIEPDHVCDSYAPETAGRSEESMNDERAKYSADEVAALGAKGQALKNANGEWSYPIGDAEDLDNAIHAVGRGGTDHDAIRKYIIRVAAKLGLSDKIPDNWNSDGSLKAENSDTTPNEVREDAGLPPQHRQPATPKRAFSSLVERAPAQVVEVEVRMDDTGDPNIANFRGYAYTIDERYGVTDWLGEYQERIGPGASSKSLREQDAIPLLLNHDGLPMANTSSRTSQLSDDGHGLLNLAALDRRQALSNDVCISLDRGDINKMSFSFRAVKDEWNDTYDDRYVRELQLYDTSIVTYPANPATSAELVDSMRSALGREGRSLWLADSELSVRSAMALLEARSRVEAGGRTGVAWADEEADLFEKALRALAHADEQVCRRFGPQGRARTFNIATSLLALRQGKVLSSSNEELLRNALSALASADKALDQVDDALDEGQGAISTVLNVANPDTDDPDENASQDGKDSNQGPSNGNPISPQDGAGPRSLPPSVIAARRQVAALKRR